VDHPSCSPRVLQYPTLPHESSSPRSLIRLRDTRVCLTGCHERRCSSIPYLYFLVRCALERYSVIKTVFVRRADSKESQERPQVEDTASGNELKSHMLNGKRSSTLSIARKRDPCPRAFIFLRRNKGPLPIITCLSVFCHDAPSQRSNPIRGWFERCEIPRDLP
jgi:hypothetical protein